MARVVVALSFAIALGCASSAPNTMASALANTAIAVGFSAASRASGGCYSPCNPGYTCNPNTGWCDRLPSVCVGAADDPRCTPAVEIPLGTTQTQAAHEAGPSPIGVSPATGRAPPQPGERPGP
jgi:hypothetical protein